jgi:transcriptional regulator GlxA family with amidase domain
MAGAGTGIAGGESSAKHIAILVLPDFAMLAYALVTDFFRIADSYFGAAFYSWSNIGQQVGPVRSSGGVAVQCSHDVHSAEQFDYVFVCASDQAVGCTNPEILDWLRRQARGGAIMGAVSGGAFLLARAGLLDGYRATIHWVYWTAFAQEFPDIDLRRTMYEIDRDRMTCGGGLASLEMLREHVSRDASPALAGKISELFLLTGGRSAPHLQRGSLGDNLGITDPGLLRALAAMEGNIQRPLSRQSIADTAGVSIRQLDRLFCKLIGSPAHEYYLELRLKRARHLVLESSMPLKEIAYACGFKSASNFSKAYRDAFSEPPSADRRRIKGRTGTRAPKASA